MTRTYCCQCGRILRFVSHAHPFVSWFCPEHGVVIREKCEWMTDQEREAAKERAEETK